MVYVDYKTCKKHNYFGANSCPKCWEKEFDRHGLPPRWASIIFFLLGVLACLVDVKAHDPVLILGAGVLFAGAIKVLFQ